MISRKKRIRMMHIYQMFPLYFLTFFLILCFALALSGRLASASATRDADPGGLQKRYTSIEIQPGDSLWSIASGHMSAGYGSVQEYIEDIKALNNMKDDEIHSGHFIIIPYY